MPYSPPANDSLDFDFGSTAYSPPATDSLDFDFTDSVSKTASVQTTGASATTTTTSARKKTATAATTTSTASASSTSGADASPASTATPSAATPTVGTTDLGQDVSPSVAASATTSVAEQTDATTVQPPTTVAAGTAVADSTDAGSAVSPTASAASTFVGTVDLVQDTTAQAFANGTVPDVSPEITSDVSPKVASTASTSTTEASDTTTTASVSSEAVDTATAPTADSGATMQATGGAAAASVGTVEEVIAATVTQTASTASPPSPSVTSSVDDSPSTSGAGTVSATSYRQGDVADTVRYIADDAVPEIRRLDEDGLNTGQTVSLTDEVSAMKNTSEGNVVAGLGNGNVKSFDPDLNLRWTHTNGDGTYIRSVGTHQDGYAYAADNRGSLLKLDDSDGSVIWKIDLPYDARDIAVSARGDVFIQYIEGDNSKFPIGRVSKDGSIEYTVDKVGSRYSIEVDPTTGNVLRLVTNGYEIIDPDDGSEIGFENIYANAGYVMEVDGDGNVIAWDDGDGDVIKSDRGWIAAADKPESMSVTANNELSVSEYDSGAGRTYYNEYVVDDGGRTASDSTYSDDTNMEVSSFPDPASNPFAWIVETVAVPPETTASASPSVSSRKQTNTTASESASASTDTTAVADKDVAPIATDSNGGVATSSVSDSDTAPVSTASASSGTTPSSDSGVTAQVTASTATSSVPLEDMDSFSTPAPVAVTGNTQTTSIGKRDAPAVATVANVGTDAQSSANATSVPYDTDANGVTTATADANTTLSVPVLIKSAVTLSYADTEGVERTRSRPTSASTSVSDSSSTLVATSESDTVKVFARQTISVIYLLEGGKAQSYGALNATTVGTETSRTGLEDEEPRL